MNYWCTWTLKISSSIPSANIKALFFVSFHFFGHMIMWKLSFSAVYKDLCVPLIFLSKWHSVFFSLSIIISLSVPLSLQCVAHTLLRSSPPSVLCRHSTLRVSAMRSSRFPPSLWIPTRPSRCPMWSPILASCPTRDHPTASACRATLWWKETTPPSPPPLSAPPLRAWSTWVWESCPNQEAALCWALHWGWWGMQTLWITACMNYKTIELFVQTK